MYQSDELLQFLIKMIKHPKSDRSFLSGNYKDIDAWRTETREWVRERLLYSPEKVPFDMYVAEEEDFGSYTRKKIFYYTAKDCKISAYLLTPKGIHRQAPAILALHDHSGRFYYGKEKIVAHKEPLPFVDWFQKFRYGGRGYASVLAEKGYVVLCPDTLGWGDRRFLDQSWMGVNHVDLTGYKEGTEEYILAFDEMWSQGHHKLAEAIQYAGASYVGIMAWDDIRSLDFLCSLPEVDVGSIGCVGLSMGGYRSALLGLLEERIKCCCIAGYMTRFQDIAPQHAPHSWAIPGVYNSLPYPDMAALTVPRDLMILNCENDSLFDLATIEAACGVIEKVYEAAGVKDRLVVNNFPCGHQFGLAMQETAFRWFDRILLTS